MVTLITFNHHTFGFFWMVQVFEQQWNNLSVFKLPKGYTFFWNIVFQDMVTFFRYTNDQMVQMIVGLFVQVMN
jgi:hypothetical protein